MGWTDRVKAFLDGGRRPARATVRREPAGSPSEIARALRVEIAERSDGDLTPESVEPDKSLFDHGYVDSMNAATLLDFVEARYGVEIKEFELTSRLSTVAALAEHIHAEAGSVDP